MTDHTISALSPLDGRYAAKLATLRPLMSEQGFMHRRVQVEVTWLLALSDSGMPEFKPYSPTARVFLRQLVADFSAADALAIALCHGHSREGLKRMVGVSGIRNGRLH